MLPPVPVKLLLLSEGLYSSLLVSRSSITGLVLGRLSTAGLVLGGSGMLFGWESSGASGLWPL